MEIRNYQAPSHSPAVTSNRRELSPGVLLVKLTGEIGPRKPISLRNVSKALEPHRYFDHVHVRLNTRGGDCEQAFAIYELLRALPKPVSTEADFRCLSAGLVVLMAGAFRLATAKTELLIHPSNLKRAYLPKHLTAASLQRRRDELAKIDARISNLFAARTGYDFRWFQDEATNELPLEPIDAIATGLVHHFEGLTGPIDPLWPEKVRSLANDSVRFQRHLTSANYLAACHCARTLYGSVA